MCPIPYFCWGEGFIGDKVDVDVFTIHRCKKKLNMMLVHPLCVTGQTWCLTKTYCEIRSKKTTSNLLTKTGDKNELNQKLEPAWEGCTGEEDEGMDRGTGNGVSEVEEEEEAADFLARFVGGSEAVSGWKKKR